MSLEDTELKVGAVKLRGVWIAIALSILTTFAGGVWATAEFYGRITDLEDQISSFDQGALNTKLTELGTNLANIMENQKELLDLRDRIAESEKQAQESTLLVEQFKEKIDGIGGRFKKINREIDDLWKGLDAASNPLR